MLIWFKPNYASRLLQKFIGKNRGMVEIMVHQSQAMSIHNFYPQKENMCLSSYRQKEEVKYLNLHLNISGRNDLNNIWPIKSSTGCLSRNSGLIENKHPIQQGGNDICGLIAVNSKILTAIQILWKHFVYSHTIIIIYLLNFKFT